MSERRYGAWAGRPDGMAEDVTRCVVQVPRGRGSVLFRQCAGKRGHGPGGLYCTRHAKMKAEGRHLNVPGEADR